MKKINKSVSIGIGAEPSSGCKSEDHTTIALPATNTPGVSGRTIATILYKPLQVDNQPTLIAAHLQVHSADTQSQLQKSRNVPTHDLITISKHYI